MFTFCLFTTVFSLIALVICLKIFLDLWHEYCKEKQRHKVLLPNRALPMCPQCNRVRLSALSRDIRRNQYVFLCAECGEYRINYEDIWNPRL